ncbi:2-amino-4-hydroxy-6-hydroxymethyldihydropteridine diphosphokinase [Endomicrobiia bacterium]|uniref:2-amino-4-hydroxy-6-hydroxymethyldihydropteridine pyrophosphokinase n=1 Tax=Endomicrobium trichonymphae TaxID=1408204 RepID=B1GZJ7_ENDTX|nr:2-amino-4-hydroxy-6-hydroxymethyldihydropteridine diphosphokinase [Candidatus Endomicrobium trichonymphae]GHT06552.1 2-amino-4-hydroxy-6-hydroxymethyldihydropteridine diphosphokinase [Endomicrobiia bacterium]BAG13679.1 7,8-dihydro-6-hydroxymethylpterin-pyrophosphokinase [Candidatus Endomicrobium trichonymphae]BAV58754.1 7,8-dihydro-6-hydroxymethylpterin-pyrophosphokinase [Candidatus Endomicrobium trichonymphae]GHT09312.1 2-amino-4-hydroxy-6-hydroxymethyldihydropteridine diphosphokinase [Endo
MKNAVYLSLGSNVGDRAENIVSALSFLQSSLFADIKKISSFYETAPIGPKQRSFYNIVIEAQTDLKPDDLLLFIKQAEHILGRRKTIRWGPRVIDIDILLFCRKIINQTGLTVPHKEIQNRLFVLIPLSEIAGDFVHPVLKQKISGILYDKSLTLKCQKVKIIQTNIANRSLKN